MTKPWRWPRLVVRLRWGLVPAWLALAVWLALTASIRLQTTASLDQVVPADLPAIRTQARAVDEFGVPLLSRSVLVQRVASGMSGAAQLAVYTRAIEIAAGAFPDAAPIVAAVPITNTFGSPTGETGTTALTYLFSRASPPAMLAAAHRVAGDMGPADGYVGVTGAVPAEVEQGRLISRSIPAIELFSILVMAVVVTFAFRAPGAAALALVTAAVAYLTALASLRGLSYFGLAFPGQLEPVIVVLILGIVTDYTILYLHGRRQHRRDGASPVDAAAGAASAATPLVCAAGITIAATTATLGLASLPLYSSVGPGLAVATGTTLVVAVTFVPALMAVSGRIVDWPTRPDAHPLPPSQKPAASRFAGHRLLAVVIAVAGLATLASAAAVLSGAKVGVDLISDLPDGTESARAARAAAEGFGPGTVAPTELVVSAPGVAANRAALDQLQHELSQFPGVDTVIGPSQQPLPIRTGIFLAPSGNAARYIIVLRQDPYQATSTTDLSRLRDELPRLLADASIADGRGSFAGDTALSAALVRLTMHDLLMTGALVLALNLVILALFLRSVLAPVLVMGTGGLVIAVAVAVTALTTGELTFYVPFAASVLLLSFGADYSVIVIGQVWRAADSEPFEVAVRTGVASSRSVLTTAGLALAGSFALLFIVPVGAFHQFATAMLTGIALDTLVARPIILPALLVLAGRRSMWPSYPRRADSHGLLETSAQQPPVDGASSHEAEQHAHLHHQPVGGVVGMQRRRREPHELHEGHPTEHPDLEGGQ